MNGQHNNGEHGDQEAPKSSSMVVKTFSVVGFIAIVILAAWLSVQVIRYTPGALSTAAVNLTSLFRGGDEDGLRLALPSRVVDSGAEVTLTVEGDQSASHTFSYECAEGVSLSVKNAEGVATTVECGAEHAFEGTTLVFVPSSSGARYSDVNLTIAAVLEDGSKGATDSALLTVENKNAEGGVATDEKPAAGNATASVTPAPQPVTREVPAPASDPNGYSDLKVTLIGTGVVASKNGNETFTRVSPIPSNKRGAVKFVVENVGTKTSEKDWYFEAELPIEGDKTYDYQSKDQPALRPGDKIEFTLSFDDILEDDKGTITVTLKPEGKDQNSGNNKFETTVRIDEK